MTPMPMPISRDVVLVGGGHTHALVLRRWGMAPIPGARLTVINPGPTAPYTGMLPGFVAGHYDRNELEIDLVRLAQFAGARIIFGLVDGIDRNGKTVHVAGRGNVAYDIASIDIGITSEMPDIKGFSDFGIAAKPLGAYAARWRSFLDQNVGGKVVVIGGGVAGIELALASAHSLGKRRHDTEITVIERGKALAGLASSARKALLAAVTANNIKLIENANVEEITAQNVILSDGRLIEADLTIGAAGARPWQWLESTGLELNSGFITVDKTLRSVSDSTIYAVGDCAHLAHAPRPKAGVFAVRAAPVLSDNLRADLIGLTHKPFRPQRDYLKLISLGEKSALGEKFGIPFSGPWVWRWKDHIDRKFMNKLENLPKMAAPSLPNPVALGVHEAIGDKPLCGGCGSKVGGAALSEVLGALPQVDRADVISGPGDDAAILAVNGANQVITTDHLRAFWDDPYVMARIAAFHALGDIWAMGATPQAALAQIVLPRLHEDMQSAWLQEIMQAASDAFQSVGAPIVGGHTTMGAELSIGFTVTGLAGKKPITLEGAKDQDALILTRPIGSGVLLAANMASEANGEDMAALLRILSTTQSDAASVLSDAHAMTDVTGFGLAGHLTRLCQASNLGAEINLDAIPVFAGAADLSTSGTASSIFSSNHADALAAGVQVESTGNTQLLFDPQTTGGLLAAVDPEIAHDKLVQIRALGHEAAIIGHVTGPQGIIVK